MEEESKVEGNAVAPAGEEEEEEEASDPELEELLDASLNEFGKHVPKIPKDTAAASSQAGAADPKQRNSTVDGVPSTGEKEMEDMFSEEFLSEMENHMGEAMKMMSSEAPELWQQFETFSKSCGLENSMAGPAPPTSGTTTIGESSVDCLSNAEEGVRVGKGSAKKEGSGTSDGKGEAAPQLEQVFEETLRKLQQNATRPDGAGPESFLGGLNDMMGQLDLGSEESEDQFMKVMQGMMSTLLSKDVLYPSLAELRRQYPDWLEKNGSSLSEADLNRYKMQLQVMTKICDEFDQGGGSGEGHDQSVTEKILTLMQELQQYGQPPADLAAETRSAMPGGPLGNMDGQNCCVM